MKREVFETSYNSLENIDDGLTLSLEGGIPTEGFVYSENENAQIVVSEAEDLSEIVSLFIDSHYGELRQSGRYIGIWKKDGEYYLDIVRIATSEGEAIEHGRKHGQLAIYDLGNRKTIYL